MKIVFRRKWFYHLITIFIQSVLLLGLAYMTFYFRINNFQVLSKINWKINYQTVNYNARIGS